MTVLRASRVETGDWQIDPAELHRVFPLAGNAVERRETALKEQIKDLRQVSELLHHVRATGIMYKTQSLAVRALRELPRQLGRNSCCESRADKGDRRGSRDYYAEAEVGGGIRQRPMTQNTARIVDEYLREAGWRERAIGAATAQAGAHAGTD